MEKENKQLEILTTTTKKKAQPQPKSAFTLPRSLTLFLLPPPSEYSGAKRRLATIIQETDFSPVAPYFDRTQHTPVKNVVLPL